MSWRTLATVFSVVFAVLLIQSVLAGPLVQTTDAFIDNRQYNNEHFNVNDTITGYVSAWFIGGLIAVFGIMLWGIARVVRRERTRGLR